MSLLDKIQTPVYDIVIPSTQKTAKFRPFFVKEERALLAAYESEDPKIMLNTLLAVVENTVEPKSAFGAGLTAYDIEYIFTHVRANRLVSIAPSSSDVTYATQKNTQRLSPRLDWT